MPLLYSVQLSGTVFLETPLEKAVEALLSFLDPLPRIHVGGADYLWEWSGRLANSRLLPTPTQPATYIVRRIGCSPVGSRSRFVYTAKRFQPGASDSRVDSQSGVSILQAM